MSDNNTPWETDITPVDTNIATLDHRNRQHLPAHSRNIGEQTLDALLRIEETTVSILEGLRHFAKLQKEASPTPEPMVVPVGTKVIGVDGKDVTKGKRK